MSQKIKKMFAAAKKANELELFVYSEIGENFYGDGVTPAGVQQAIKEAGPISKITVHVNSPGGASFDGVTIHNILRQQKVPVHVIVEGLAASAAFTIAMAGDTVQVCDGAMMMLHNAWTLAIGDAKDLRAMADTLDKVSGTLCDLYSKHSGLSAEAVQQLMDAETWLTADEAVAQGFASERLATTPEKAAEAKALSAQFDLSKFCSKVPDAMVQKPDPEPDPNDPDEGSEGERGDQPNEAGCMCVCDACMRNDCKNCAMADCKDPNCVHAEADDTAAEAKGVDEVRSRQLRYLEATAPK